MPESKLRQCKGDAVAWCHALEIAFDHARFDFVMRILRTLVKRNWISWTGQTSPSR